MSRQDNRLLQDLSGVDVNGLFNRHDTDHDSQPVSVPVGASPRFVRCFELHCLTGAEPASLHFKLLHGEEFARRHDPRILQIGG